MSKILFAAELGGGLGHVGRLGPIAQALASEGHEVAFAVPDASAAAGLLRFNPSQLLASPALPERKGDDRPVQAATYADVLAWNGYDETERLAPYLQAWSHLIECFSPQLVVVDHGPTVCLAANGEVPVVVVGDGFTIPPLCDDHFPRISNSPLHVAPHSILGVIQTVQRERGRQAPRCFATAFRSEAQFLLTYEELDPYRDHRRATCSGPLERLEPRDGVAVADHVFAYLDGSRAGVADLLVACVEAGLSVEAYVPNLPTSHRGPLLDRGVKLHVEPRPLRTMLANASAVIHHGGLNTATAAMTAGVPQLALPRYLEQSLNAQALVNQGVGQILAGRHTRRSLGQAVRRLIHESTAPRLARELAIRVTRRSPRDRLGDIVTCCRQLAI